VSEKGREKRDQIRSLGSRTIAAYAAGHHGVIDDEELHALGFDKHAIGRRRANGLLHELYPGVYAVGHRSVSPRGRLFAAVVACGPKAALSHRSGAYLADLRSAPARIEVTIPRGAKGPRGIKTHESRMLDERDVTTIDGIRVTTVARTLLDLAAIAGPRELKRALDRAERLELFDLRAIDDVFSRARGRRGARALREAVEDWRPRFTRQELEDRFFDLCEEAGFSLPLTNVVVAGYEVDAYWPEQRLVVELDSWTWHRTREDHERDAAKTADLELAGERVIRPTWNEVTKHKPRTIRRLRKLLGGYETVTGTAALVPTLPAGS
jgi:very-short-patch-repair endonuclease